MKNLTNLPKYMDLLKQQPYIENQDFSPIVLDNVLFQDQIYDIYKKMNSYNKEKIRVQKWGGQGIFDGISMSDGIRKRICDVVSNALNDDFILEEYSFVRYTPEYGYDVKLFPHYDTRSSQRVVLDIQLNATEKWDIIVENENFNLKNNQGLIFYGTQQMHWREKKKLLPDTQIDMVFCWLKYKNDRMLTTDHTVIMKERESVLLNELEISNREEEY